MDTVFHIYFIENIHTISLMHNVWGPSWPWSYGSWIYNYLYMQSVEPLMLWVWISIRARCTTLCDKVCQWLARGLIGQWFSPGPSVSSTNKTDCHNITEILFKVTLNTIKQINKHSNLILYTSMALWITSLLKKTKLLIRSIAHYIFTLSRCIHTWNITIKSHEAITVYM